MIRKPNFKLNWKYALGEVALIFIGISLAIAFQNFNENRKAKKQSVQLLIGLKSDLENDITQIESLNSSLIERRDRAQLLLNYSRNMPKAIDTAEVVIVLERAGWIYSFRPSRSVYNEMISSGKVSLIKSDHLKRRLDRYTSRVENVREIESINSKQIRLFEFSIAKYMDEGLGISGHGDTAPEIYDGLNIELKALLRDEEMIWILKNIVNLSNSEVRYKRDLVKPLIQEIIELIDQELTQ